MRNLGADCVREASFQTLITEFENLKMSDNDTIDTYAAKLSGIASNSATLGEVMSEHKMVKKFLTSLPRRFIPIVVVLEQVLDLKATSTDTLFQDALNETETMKLTLMRHKRKMCIMRKVHFMMNRIKETIFINEEKYTPPNYESNTDEDDVWYFDNDASNHMTGNYSYFSELDENITGRVRFGDGSCVSIKGKGSILFQGKNREQKLLKDVYYIPALQSNVITLGQATISGYDISIRDDFLTMRYSCGDLLINVPRSATHLYKAQLKVGKEDTNQRGKEAGKLYCRMERHPLG
ncbi:hypothetical protein Tco_0654558 [Tanacetum coccineum]|uniref:Retrovirus-related Pol polyprotein from transposon TNT 1-94-like beta-barrel domain-containing protein n=1 Tax=Tanacetum coccineum TaxID=301880 RepID=A0ABQ4X3I7_9ASTR